MFSKLTESYEKWGLHYSIRSSLFENNVTHTEYGKRVLSQNKCHRMLN